MKKLTVLVLVGLLVPSVAGAYWDDPLSEFMSQTPTARLYLISGYLGMFEAYNDLPVKSGGPEIRYNCDGLMIGTVQDTIEQLLRSGKLDPKLRTSAAVAHTLVTLCKPVTVKPSEPEPRPRPSSREPTS